ncbi:MAG: hypothetical protein K2G36_00900 [Ruminococcus sp.]|nr:hypothetical protein [Ruminococcus sp.]
MYRIKILLILMISFFSMTFSEIRTDATVKSSDYVPPEFSDNTEMRTVTENENYRLLVYDKKAIFGLQDRKSGYIWWSSPVDVLNDDIKPVVAENLMSSAVLKYGNLGNHTENNYVRSDSPVCTVGVSDIPDGMRIDYNSGNFHFYVDYVLEKDCLRAVFDTSGLVEKSSSEIATEITIAGNFGASDDTESGYFIVPDGCGTLINFNNGKTDADSYRQKIYGENVAIIPEKISYTEQAYLPIYSIVRENNALLAIASQGDTDVYITANVSGQSGSNYNTCNFTFILRNTDNYHMGDGTENITVFENGDIDCGNIEIIYYPIVKDDVNYVDVAEIYRKYLIEKCGLAGSVPENYSPLYIKFYGGAEKKKTFCGIPVMRKQKITSYVEAVEILEKLGDIDSMIIAGQNFTDSGIENKFDTDFRPSGVLGGERDFNKLMKLIKENNYEFYTVSDTEYFSGNGLGIFSGTMRISGSYTQIPSYNPAFSKPDNSRKKHYLLSPDNFDKIYNFSGKLTSVLYGDYGRNKITRYRSREIIRKNISDGDVFADGANAYILPYVRHVINIPLHSSRFDISDMDVPFYQIVLHGIVPYTSTAINASADIDDILLMSAVTGSSLYYDLIGSAEEIGDTEFDYLFYADSAYWTDTVSRQYGIISPVLKTVSNATITGYTVENDGQTITAEFSSGDVIKSDFSGKTLAFNDKIIYTGSE